MRAVAFVTISNILALKVLGRSRILSIAFETLPVPPAAAGRIVLAAFGRGGTDVAVF